MDYLSHSSEVAGPASHQPPSCPAAHAHSGSFSRSSQMSNQPLLQRFGQAAPYDPVHSRPHLFPHGGHWGPPNASSYQWPQLPPISAPSFPPQHGHNLQLSQSRIPPLAFEPYSGSHGHGHNLPSGHQPLPPPSNLTYSSQAHHSHPATSSLHHHHQQQSHHHSQTAGPQQSQNSIGNSGPGTVQESHYSSPPATHQQPQNSTSSAATADANQAASRNQSGQGSLNANFGSVTSSTRHIGPSPGNHNLGQRASYHAAPQTHHLRPTGPPYSSNSSNGNGTSLPLTSHQISSQNQNPNQGHGHGHHANSSNPISLGFFSHERSQSHPHSHLHQQPLFNPFGLNGHGSTSGVFSSTSTPGSRTAPMSSSAPGSGPGARPASTSTTSSMTSSEGSSNQQAAPATTPGSSGQGRPHSVYSTLGGSELGSQPPFGSGSRHTHPPFESPSPPRAFPGPTPAPLSAHPPIPSSRSMNMTYADLPAAYPTWSAANPAPPLAMDRTGGGAGHLRGSSSRDNARRSMTGRPSTQDGDESGDEFSPEALANFVARGEIRGGDDLAVRAAQFLRGQVTSKIVASPAAIDALQKVEIAELDENNKHCIICYNDFGKDTPEGIREIPLRLPTCGHIFGDHCIKKWFSDAATCPYCRTKVPSHSKMEINARALEEFARARNVPSRQVMQILMGSRRQHRLSAEDRAHMAAAGAVDAEMYRVLRHSMRHEDGPDLSPGARRSPPSDSGEGRRRLRARLSSSSSGASTGPEGTHFYSDAAPGDRSSRLSFMTSASGGPPGFHRPDQGANRNGPILPVPSTGEGYGSSSGQRYPGSTDYLRWAAPGGSRSLGGQGGSGDVAMPDRDSQPRPDGIGAVSSI